MAIGRVIHESGVMFPDFDMFEINYELFETDWEMKFFLNIPHLTKVDILEYFENIAFGRSISGGECDWDFVPISDFDLNGEILAKIEANDPQPNYISEYIHIVGQLFLAGYIEFGMCGLQDKEENLLSNQKEDKYQAWIYFRDNFFYANAFDKSDDEDILIYEDKEYTPKNCPTYFNTETKRRKYCGYSTMYSDTSWDTPQYWSQYNIWVARTEKGTKYFNEILAPRFYNKYKDLSVEIDSEGNIIRWIGKINR